MQQYKKFWAQSRRDNKTVYVSSSNPEYELSLCFFTPDVLSKYRARPEMYIIDEGILRTSNNEWILQSCYTSPDNQIYCYLYDLSLLPEKEQAYWQLFNLQKPTGKETSLSINRDFFCSFEDSEKQVLLQVLRKISIVKIINNKQLWSPKENLEQMINEIAFPLVEEYKQYRDDFLAPLARLIIEGFIFASLEEWALSLKIVTKNNCGQNLFGSIVLLEKCLSFYYDLDQQKNIITPLKELQNEKSRRSSHGGKSKNGIIIISQSKELYKSVVKAMTNIIDHIEKLNF